MFSQNHRVPPMLSRYAIWCIDCMSIQPWLNISLNLSLSTCSIGVCDGNVYGTDLCVSPADCGIKSWTMCRIMVNIRLDLSYEDNIIYSEIQHQYYGHRWNCSVLTITEGQLKHRQQNINAIYRRKLI